MPLSHILQRTKAVKIIDPDTGVALGANVVGEITYQSDYPMLGYLNQPEENERFFGKDGFLHSGDLGHYDEAGNLYFDGRLKELIKYKNYHLYPNELEELLMANEAVRVKRKLWNLQRKSEILKHRMPQCLGNQKPACRSLLLPVL